jgi:hypothetical protein
MSTSVDVLEVEGELYRQIEVASGMTDLLKMVAEEEDEKGGKCAAKIYLFADVQNHIVESLRKVAGAMQLS